MSEAPRAVHVAEVPAGSVSVRVCTYNVLAQHLVNRKVFPYAESSALRQAARRPRVLRAIEEAAADVLCLQEVERREQWLLPWLEEHGYDMAYQQKTHGKADGVLVAWRAARFDCLARRAVEFEHEPGCDPRPEEALEYGAPASTAGVALAAVLRAKEDPRVVLSVGTSHIWWVHEMKRVKNMQIQRVITLVEESARAAVAEAFADPAEARCLLLLGLDMNTEPNDEPYQVATHLFDFKSLADHMPAAARGCGWTNITEKYQGWIDHIMWKQLRLAGTAPLPQVVLVSANALPSAAEVMRAGKVTGYPDTAHGSDHVPLVCTLALLGG